MKIEELATVLKAAGETHRLRILALCANGDLSVNELTRILGLSQPGVSRHLRSLCDARLLERRQEGSHAYFHFSGSGAAGEITQHLISALDANCSLVMRDKWRLEQIHNERAAKSRRYFRDNARRWDQIRALYVEEERVESEIRKLTESVSTGSMLDIGTGTGRMLQVFADRVRAGVGIDLSHNMLSVARVNLSQPEFAHCSVRQSDMYSLPFDAPVFDLITLHMVLHFAERPQEALAEAARVLIGGGHLLIVDFAPHALHELRDTHAHLRLGFDTSEVKNWAAEQNLSTVATRALPGESLTVNVWMLRNSSNIRPAAA